MTPRKMKRTEIGQIQFMQQTMRDLQHAAGLLELCVAEIFESKGVTATHAKQAAKQLLVQQLPIVPVLNNFNIKAVS